MKGQATILFCCLAALCCFADGLPRESVGPGTVKVVWATTNNLPKTVWIYKIIPQNFAPPVISNAMAMALFTMSDRTNVAGQPPFADKTMLYFYDSKTRRELGIYPSLGWIHYSDPQAEASGTNKVLDVPSQEAVYQLGSEYIQRLGIDRSQLATAGNGGQLRVPHEINSSSWVDKASGANYEQTNSRGLFYIRRVNGIDFDGIAHGGVQIDFGNQGKVTRLEVLWKGLEPYELHDTLTVDQIIEEIKRGDVKWLSPAPDPNEIKKITITDIIPLYRGVLEDDEETKYLQPYSRLKVIIDCDHTNIAANLECQICSTNLAQK